MESEFEFEFEFELDFELDILLHILRVELWHLCSVQAANVFAMFVSCSRLLLSFVCVYDRDNRL